MNRILAITAIAAITVLTVQPANAAELYFGAPNRILPMEAFELGVFLNTQGDTVNAFDGAILLPAGLELIGSDAESSSVTAWMINPAEQKECQAPCRLPFAGMIVGGYATDAMKLFTMHVRPTSTGMVSVTADGLSVARADGEGTLVPAHAAPISLIFSDTESSALAAGWPDSYTAASVCGILILLFLSYLLWRKQHSRVRR